MKFFIKFETLKISNCKNINKYKIKFYNIINKLFIYLNNSTIDKN